MRWLLLIGALLAVACGGRTTPQATPMPTTDEPPIPITLLFTGDVMQHSPQLTAARKGDRYDYTDSFTHIAPLLRAADLTVVNLETTLADEPPYAGYPLFRSPAALAEELADVGVDVACLANNHALDGGGKGVRSTVAILDRTGLRHTGIFADSCDRQHNHPLHLNVQGVRITLLNYTYGTNGLATPEGIFVNRIDTTRIQRDLAASAEADCRIVCIHWGNEYERRPNARQRALATLLRRAGADVVIGHHPHVIQPFEADSTGAVFYSLGNFVSNQRRRYRDGGLMARITLTRRSDGSLRYFSEAIPVWVDRNGYRILPCEAADTMALGEAYRTFRADTDSLLFGR